MAVDMIQMRNLLACGLASHGVYVGAEEYSCFLMGDGYMTITKKGKFNSKYTDEDIRTLGKNLNWIPIYIRETIYESKICTQPDRVSSCRWGTNRLVQLASG